MKRQFLGILVILLAMAIILVGCSSTPASPTTSTALKPSPLAVTTAPAPATTQATAPVKPIELKVSIYEPPTSFSGKAATDWIKKMDQLTQGRVKATLYPSEALGKTADQWEILKSGVADMAWILPMYYPGVFPQCDFGDVPFVVPLNPGLPLFNRIFDKYLYKDWSAVKVVWGHWMGGVQIHTSKKAIRTLEDLKGLQIRTPAGPQANTYKTLGAVPVAVALPEVYSALEKGTVQGASMAWMAISSQKIGEVTTYHTVVDMFVGIGVMGMNLDKWKSLPPDIQKIINDNIPWAQETGYGYLAAEVNDAIALAKLPGKEIITISPQERARWTELLKSQQDEFAAKLEAKGLPGKALLAEVVK